jgi:AraC family transcriptional regulator
MDPAIEEVIFSMSGRLDEPMTVDDLARSAKFSKYYFTRLFRRATGMSPGRFLSAMRLDEAKRLLMTTSLRVADISCRVGYTSVGTFTSRFTTTVGVSPTHYRRLGRSLGDDVRTVPATPAFGATVVAVVHPPAAAARTTFVGVFPARWPVGEPVVSAVLDVPGPCRFEGVPAGRWCVICAFTKADCRCLHGLADLLDQTTLLAKHGPFEVGPREPFAVTDVKPDSARAPDAATVRALRLSIGRTPLYPGGAAQPNWLNPPRWNTNGLSPAPPCGTRSADSSRPTKMLWSPPS